MTTETPQNPAEPQEESPLAGVKVVVTIMDGGVAMIGISQGAVDPHVEACAISPTDDLQSILAVVPEVLERARERWSGVPRFVAYKAPAPNTTPPARSTTTTTGRRRANQPPPEAEAPRMF